MSTFRVLVTAPNSEGYPFDPFVHIALEEWSESESGAPLLSPQLMTPQEIDYCADRLIEEINRARTEAKKRLTHAREKLLKQLETRRSQPT